MLCLEGEIKKIPKKLNIFFLSDFKSQMEHLAHIGMYIVCSSLGKSEKLYLVHINTNLSLQVNIQF